MVGELVDGVLTVQQRPHDLQPGRIGEQLEHTSSDLELDVVRLVHLFARLRSHADDDSGRRLRLPFGPARMSASASESAATVHVDGSTGTVTTLKALS